MGVKVVHNASFGGFRLSGKAIRYFMELKGKCVCIDCKRRMQREGK